MSMRPAPLAIALAGTLLLLVTACAPDDSGSRSAVSIATATPVETPTPLPTPSPTPTPVPPRDSPGCATRLALARKMAQDIEVVLEGYEAEWGFAFIDVSCKGAVSIHPEYSQYAASAGKIVSVIAVLQAVQRGDLPLEEVDQSVNQVLTLSLDEPADYIETFLEPGALNAVLDQAGTLSARIDTTWRETNISATDLARLWAALVNGQLLNEELTAYLLKYTRETVIPEGFETFPDSDFELDGYRYGQKAGYFVSDGVPYFFVGAGYLNHEATGDYFIPVIVIETEIEDLLDPRRFLVFPVVVDYVEQMVATGESR